MLEIYACKRNAHSNWWHFIRAQFSKKLFELLSPLILNQLWYFSHWGIKTYCKTNTDNANCFWSPQIHWRILTLSTSFGERICFFFFCSFWNAETNEPFALSIRSWDFSLSLQQVLFAIVNVRFSGILAEFAISYLAIVSHYLI